MIAKKQGFLTAGKWKNGSETEENSQVIATERNQGSIPSVVQAAGCKRDQHDNSLEQYRFNCVRHPIPDRVFLYLLDVGHVMNAKEFNKAWATIYSINRRYRCSPTGIQWFNRGGFAQWAKDSSGNVVLVRWMPKEAA